MLKQVDAEIWVAEQPIRYFKLSIRTRMTLIRLANRQLAAISPIRMDDELMGQLKEIGEIAYIIAPNLYHHLFAAEWKSCYPKAAFWGAPRINHQKARFAY